MQRRYYYERNERNVSGCCICFLMAAMVTVSVCTMVVMLYETNPEIFVDNDSLTLVFNEFKKDYAKVYRNEEEEGIRKKIFIENYQKILAFNNGKRSFELGVNQFADLTLDEYRKFYLSKSEPVDLSEINYDTPFVIPTEDEPKDWVKEGKVSHIRDQGHCGSCWTFASVSAAESLYAIRENTSPVSLSEQQLVDCCKTELSDGCYGGERWEAFDCMTKYGIARREDYPYKARNEVCRQDDVKKFMKLNHYENSTKGNSIELAERVRRRPVSVGVNASPFVFMFYKKGIISEGCPWNEINHAVVAVGVGVGVEENEKGMPFWKIRNSWGVKWGEDGYVRIKRDLDTTSPGQCAVAMKGCMPLYHDEF